MEQFIGQEECKKVARERPHTRVGTRRCRQQRRSFSFAVAKSSILRLGWTINYICLCFTSTARSCCTCRRCTFRCCCSQHIALWKYSWSAQAFTPLLHKNSCLLSRARGCNTGVHQQASCPTACGPPHSLLLPLPCTRASSRARTLCSTACASFQAGWQSAARRASQARTLGCGASSSS